MSEKITQFLKEHELININLLEQRCGMPRSTIDKCLYRGRKIPIKHQEKLIEVLKNYGF